MKTATIAIFILILAGAAGFYLGLKNRAVEVVVRGPVDIASTSTATSTTIILRGEQLGSGGIATDLFGENFKTRLPSLPWYISRAAAITAYLLMFAIIVWGAGMTTGFTYRVINPVEAWGVHKYLSISLGALVLVHIISLLFDKFLKFRIRDLLIPFASGYKPVYLSLGIIAFYLLVIITFSSLVLRLRMPKLWRAVHDLTYPLFGYTFLHGAFVGTDAQTPVLKAVYWTTGAIFLTIVIYRLIIYYKKKKM